MEKPILLLSRPQRQSQRFADRLKYAIGGEMSAKIDCVIDPVTEIIESEISPDPAAIKYDTAIFTSENAIQPATKLRSKLGQSALCVGAQVTETARMSGWAAEFVGATVAEFIDQHPLNPTQRYMYFRGEEITFDLAEHMRGLDFNIGEITVYHQCVRQISAETRRKLQDGQGHILTFFSAQSAVRFHEQTKTLDLGHCHAVSISDAVFDVLASTSFSTHAVANSPNASGMIDCIAQRITSGEFPQA
jgi:uroporphyrinogen-III synthase